MEGELTLEELYAAQQILLKELVKSEGKTDKEYQGAIKRQIGRINKQLEILDK